MSAAPIEHVTDLTELVGEFDIPCDGIMHGTGISGHADGPATHYVQLFHSCPARKPGIEARCAGNIAFLAAHMDGLARCSACESVYPLTAGLKIIGPIDGF